MTNEEKLRFVMAFLAENHIKYWFHEVVRVGEWNLCLPKLRVYIKIDGFDGQDFFNKYKKFGYPIFVRDEETAEFILEKVQETIFRSMVRAQEAIDRKAKREENRRINEVRKKAADERRAKKRAKKMRGRRPRI